MAESSVTVRTDLSDRETARDSENEEPTKSEHEYAMVPTPPSVTNSTASSSHHRTVRTGTSVFIPHDIIQRPKMVALATRLQMTPAHQAIYTKALIEEAGGDTSKITASYSSADRSRRKVGQQIAGSLMEKWTSPELATVHWDSKLMPSLHNKYVKEERLTVVVGTRNEQKLLGTPVYKPVAGRKTGDIVAELTVDMLKSWHCEDNIVNMTFDTTASNTGHVTAACVMLQGKLNRALLWSPCRHHIG